jgi:hypothetical protein
MSRCDRPSASCARTFRPSDQPRRLVRDERAAEKHRGPFLLCVNTCQHRPQSVNNRCGEDGDCFPVLIHTRVFNHPSACCPRFTPTWNCRSRKRYPTDIRLLHTPTATTIYESNKTVEDRRGPDGWSRKIPVEKPISVYPLLAGQRPLRYSLASAIKSIV